MRIFTAINSNMLGTTLERPTSQMVSIWRQLWRMAWRQTQSVTVTDDNAMVWRGPMASKALMQMLQGLIWIT